MSDSVSVTSHHSYGSRLGNSFKAILWGIILVIVSIILLAWNENRYVKTKAGINEWKNEVQETVSTQINPDLEGKEVHLYGELSSNEETLQDNMFWIITNDLKLKRTVEMYQWDEDSEEKCHDNLWWSKDCTITYTYDKKWSDDAIDSNNFQKSEWHENPSNREFTSTTQEKSPITLWVYTLSNTFTNKLTDYKTINLSEQNIKIPEKYQEKTDSTTQEITTDNAIENNNDNYLYWDSENTNTWNTEATDNTSENSETNDTVSVNSNENFHIYDSYIYIWKNPNEPEVWDLKITFSSVKPSTVSIVWRQVGNELTTYTTPNGTTIAYLEQWNISADDMFLHAQQANKQITWLLRLVWLLLMYCGFASMFKFIETLAKVLPFLANIIWFWTGIIALWLTLVVWFLTIWIAWLAVRPVIWLCCLIVAVAGIFLLISGKKNRSSNKETSDK